MHEFREFTEFGVRLLACWLAGGGWLRLGLAGAGWGWGLLVLAAWGRDLTCLVVKVGRNEAKEGKHKKKAKHMTARASLTTVRIWPAVPCILQDSVL